MQTDMSAPTLVGDLRPLNPDGPARAPVISVVAAKGGAGKSTFAANAAVHLSRENLHRPALRVLAIDAEPQGHLGTKLGAPDDGEYDVGDMADAFKCAELDRGTGTFDSFELHFGDHPLSGTGFENVYLLRGGLELLRAREQVNSGGLEGEYWLQTVCEFFGQFFDVIVIDSPPAFAGVLGIRAIHAADLIVSPVICDDEESVRSFDDFIEAVEPLGANLAPIVPVAMAPRTSFNLWKGIDAAIQEEGVDGYLQAASELMATVTKEKDRRGPWLAIAPYDIEVKRQGAKGRPIVATSHSGSLAGIGLREAADRAYAIARRRVEDKS